MNPIWNLQEDSKKGFVIGLIKRFYRTFKFVKKFKPDLLIGTCVENSFISKITGIPCINVNEDDAAIVPLYAKLSYPWATEIITPKSCDNGKWNSKSIKYNSYHELAYLHPKYFTPSKGIASQYVDTSDSYFIIRFAKLTAHHDEGITGLNREVTRRIINQLDEKGKIYITSEKPLEEEFEPYRLSINAKDIHHVMAFSTIFIGDSQTMAAEAGLLGTPFIRYNSFVGRIGYLNEIENKYKLGFGVKFGDEKLLFKRLSELIEANNRNIYSERRNKMLNEKIDVTAFYVWFIENYPNSVTTMNENPNYQNHFK